MTEQSTPVPEDPREHAKAAAEGAPVSEPAETVDTREHSSDPAEGA